MAKPHGEIFQTFLKNPGAIARALRTSVTRRKKSAVARKLEKGSAPAMEHAIRERLRGTAANAPIWTALNLAQVRQELREKQSLAPVEAHLDDYIGRFTNGTEAMAMLAYVVIHDGFSPFGKKA